MAHTVTLVLVLGAASGHCRSLEGQLGENGPFAPVVPWDPSAPGCQDLDGHAQAGPCHVQNMAP